MSEPINNLTISALKTFVDSIIKTGVGLTRIKAIDHNAVVKSVIDSIVMPKPHSTVFPYKQYDTCWFEGQLYFANEATQGAFNPAKWVLIITKLSATGIISTTSKYLASIGAGTVQTGTILLTDTNFTPIGGNGVVSYIQNTGWTSGSRTFIKFTGNVTLMHNASVVLEENRPILLKRNENYVTQAGEILEFVLNDGKWEEIGNVSALPESITEVANPEASTMSSIEQSSSLLTDSTQGSAGNSLNRPSGATYTTAELQNNFATIVLYINNLFADMTAALPQLVNASHDIGEVRTRLTDLLTNMRKDGQKILKTLVDGGVDGE